MDLSKQTAETLQNSGGCEYTHFRSTSSSFVGLHENTEELLRGHRRQNEDTTESDNFQGRRISVLLLLS